VLEHNPAQGITFHSADSENLDIYSAFFNPKKRIIVAGGSHHIAMLWDLQSDEGEAYR
jgi:hypothetical protein